MAEELKTLTKHVVAVMSGHGSAEAAAAALRDQGLEKQAIFRNEDVSEEIDPRGESSGLLSRLLKAVEDHLSEEQNYLAQYEEEARNGKDVIAVSAEGDAEVDRAASILAGHGAYNIRYFGVLAVKDLSPESNPSSRSEESPESENWSKI